MYQVYLESTTAWPEFPLSVTLLRCPLPWITIMHHRLSIDEILQEIFRCIESRSTLYALARTCRTFSDPAVDRIWETLTAIEPALLKNLSSARQ